MHFDLKLFLIHFVTFLAGMLGVWFIALKGFIKMLKEKDEKFKKLELDTMELKMKYENAIKGITEEKNAMLKEVETEKNRIIMAAEKKAKEIIEDAIKKSENEIKKAQAILEDEKRRMLEDVKREAIQYAIKIASRVLNEKIDEKKDSEFIRKIIGA